MFFVLSKMFWAFAQPLSLDVATPPRMPREERQQHRIGGTVSAEAGSFYGGTKTTAGLSGGRVQLSTRGGTMPRSYSRYESSR